MGFLPRIEVLLCAPPPTGAVGGGYLYNQALSANPHVHYHYIVAASLRTELPRILTEAAQAGRRVTHILLDSLYLTTPTELSAAQAMLQTYRRHNRATLHVGLLAHLLPSQNLQGRPAADRIRAETTEAILLRMFSFGVAPSQFAARELHRRALPASRVGVAYPAPIITPPASTAAVRAPAGAPMRAAASVIAPAGAPMRAPAGAPNTKRMNRNPNPGPTLSFLSVGNWTPRKNLTGLVQVFGALKQYDWCWQIVVGDSAEQELSGRTEFTAMLKMQGIQDRVSIESQPTRSRLNELYRRADCFVMAPHAETFGIVFAEALAYGCVVIAPDSPPFTEFLTPRVDSLLCHPQRTEDWINAVKTVFSDQGLRSRMQTNALAAPAGRRNQGDTARDLVNFLSGLRADIPCGGATPEHAARGLS